MKQEAFVLQNRGMNRDTSISKAENSSAFENHNIRVLARDHDTLLSVTNERGNKEIVLNGAIVGTLIGWNVLNNHIILFTHDETEGVKNPDYIYRIDYVDGNFIMARGDTDSGNDSYRGQIDMRITEDTALHRSNEEKTLFRVTEGNLAGNPLFNGNLNFSVKNPIESVVYYETESIQKIYWVDGRNVLRFMNFMADIETVTTKWAGDNTYFDSNRAVDFMVNVDVEKTNSGNKRPNGVVQYLLTYYNKYGQESGYVWVSDLIYLAPFGHGGSADSYNNNSVTLKLSFLYEDFEYFRVYSIFRSSLNGQTTAYLIYDGKTQGGEAIVTDDGSSEEAVDSSRLLYLGSKSVHAGTITHKDQTLFLGDLQSVGNNYNSVLETAIKNNMFITQGQSEEGFIDGVTWESACVVFKYTSSKNLDNPECDIPYVKDSGIYPYQNQTLYSSSQISTFKGGEKYRFAVVFRTANGVSSEAFWIGDAVNPLYPVIDPDGTIHRVVAECHIPKEVVATLQSTDYVTAQLMVAQATYADRSIKAQGILNPTMFNVWERYNDRQYAYPSWIFRPRGSSFAYKHFEPVHNSTSTEGELECNYWETETAPTPYYQLENISTSPDFVDSFDGISDYSRLKIIYSIYCENQWFKDIFSGQAIVFKAVLNGANPRDSLVALNAFQLTEEKWNKALVSVANNGVGELTDNADEYVIKVFISPNLMGYGTRGAQKESLWAQVDKFLSTEHAILEPYRVSKLTYQNWCFIPENHKKKWYYFENTTNSNNIDISSLFNSTQFISIDGNKLDGLGSYVPSYYRKHLMFVDENVLTFNSPELSYEATSFDNANFKLRIVGAIKITGNITDYTVSADHGKLSGENLITQSFNTMNESDRPDGLTTWPLWLEYGLKEREHEQDSDTVYTPNKDKRSRVSYDYEWGGNFIRYWLNMWKHSGKINGFTDVYEYDYSNLRTKTFANLRYAYWTIYNNAGEGQQVYDLDGLRMFTFTNSQYVQLGIGTDSEKQIKHYDGYINTSFSVPNGFKYPICSSAYEPLTTSETLYSDEPDLYSNLPVPVTYGSTAHAVLSLHSYNTVTGRAYIQTILPEMFPQSEKIGLPTVGTARVDDKTGALIPWGEINSGDSQYAYKDYGIHRDQFSLVDYNTDVITEGDRYLFIGEIFDDYSNKEDTRYGGITSAAVNSNTFNVAGPIALIRQMNPSVNSDANILIGNQADTFFQRWDCLKTVPLSSDNTNNVIDILSCMLETHINIDGRTDLQRGINKIASINTETFGQLNSVYSQGNNFFANMDLDSKYNLDAYRSTITWSMQKADAADVDEWSHVTLANTLNLDGDKGFCRALRRFQNSIIAFQDRGISEVLFNSRTQVSTTDGVPIEIANSGKVDGKRYISNKYGCLNKWSITEGKSGLYFVDNINKTFALIGNQGVEPLSTRLHFDVWFREKNNMEPWNPKDFNNFVSFYDKVHSDIYLVKDNTNDDQSCLVYSELLGSFTSFYDYASVPMMVNVEDRFVSFRDDKLWLQNEGLYCNFFGDQYDFWVQYRVTPDPYGDKIWSTLEYRSDFFRVLTAGGNSSTEEGELIDGGQYYNGLLINGDYQPDMTFDKLNVWNEYQNAQEINPWLKNKDKYPDVRKKFRIWRMDIPRAVVNRTNKYGLDRIRNPWVNIKLTKDLSSETALATGYNRCMMQMHDVIVRYFGEL